MTDQRHMTDEEKMRNAGEARMIMEHPLVVAALKEMERMCVEALVHCDMEKPEVERRFVESLRVVRQFKSRLQEHIDTGKIAEINQKQSSLFDRIRRKVA